MGRYWRIYRTFFTSSLARELEFRANFFAKIAQGAVWIFFFVMILLVVYSNTDKVAGWTRGDSFVLAATCFVLNALASALFLSLMEIPNHVRQGTLDFVITKPIDTQFWISSRKFNFDQLGTLFAGLVMLFIGVRSSGADLGAENWTAFGLLVVCALVIFYSFNLALMTLGIWLVRVENLWVLSESVVQVARYPMDIYSSGLQKILTYVAPLAFLATVPARQLVREVDWMMVGVGVVWAAVFALGARRFWLYALRHYASASS